jgi:hypothetical protein
MLRSHHLLTVVVSAAAVGCSASRYDADYTARIAAFRADAEFAELEAAPRELAEGRVLVRLPTKFAAAADESRIPSLLFLRGLPEATVFNASMVGPNNWERRPVVVTAAVPVARRRPDDLKREIGEWIKADNAFSLGKWNERKVTPANGGPAEWHVLSLDGPQLFEAVDGTNELGDRNLDGTGELWVSTAADRDYCVLICVRMPNDVAGQFRNTPAQLAELMARRVEILPPPAEPAAK